MFLILAVTATLFLAVDVFLINVVSSLDENTAMIISGSAAPVIMIVLLATTSLGKGVKDSFTKNKKQTT